MKKELQVLSVPIPVKTATVPAGKRRDLRPLQGASSLVGRVLGKGDIVVCESTVYPGATEEICIPFETYVGLENSHHWCGKSDAKKGTYKKGDIHDIYWRG